MVQEEIQQEIPEESVEKLIEKDKNRILGSAYIGTYKSIEDMEIFERAEYVTTNASLLAKHRTTQLKMLGKLRWTTTRETGLRHRIEENLPCRMCNTGEVENTTHILIKCLVYEKVEPKMLKKQKVGRNRKSKHGGTSMGANKFRKREAWK